MAMAPDSPASPLAREFLEHMSRLGFDGADVLLPGIQWVHAARGEVLFEEGQPGRSLYLILRGRVRVVNGRDRLDERTVAVLGR